MPVAAIFAGVLLFNALGLLMVLRILPAKAGGLLMAGALVVSCCGYVLGWFAPVSA